MGIVTVLRGAFEWSDELCSMFVSRIRDSEAGHSKALSLDGKFDPDNISEKKKMTHKTISATDSAAAVCFD